MDAAPTSDQPLLQLFWLFILAIPISTVAWTMTHEEVFRELREYCVRRSKTARTIWARKFFYMFTCEYCFSHYVTLFFLILTGYRLLLEDWRGFVLSFLALVWVANVYMSLYSRLRVDITAEQAEVKEKEKMMERLQTEIESERAEGRNKERDAGRRGGA